MHFSKNNKQSCCRLFSNRCLKENSYTNTIQPKSIYKESNRIHIPIWGTYITTPEVSPKEAKVAIEIKTSEPNSAVAVETRIVDSKGKEVARSKEFEVVENRYYQQLTIANPSLWSPESPALYYAETTLKVGSKAVDCYRTRFGVQCPLIAEMKVFYIAKGSFVNEEKIGTINTNWKGKL